MISSDYMLRDVIRLKASRCHRYRLQDMRFLNIVRAPFQASSPFLGSWGKNLIIQHNMFVIEGDQYYWIQVLRWYQSTGIVDKWWPLVSEKIEKHLRQDFTDSMIFAELEKGWLADKGADRCWTIATRIPSSILRRTSDIWPSGIFDCIGEESETQKSDHTL